MGGTNVPRVAIVKGEDVDSMVSKAVSLLGGIEGFVRRGERAFIKPNVCGGVPGKAGTFTSTAVLSAAIKLVKRRTEKVAIGEADSSMYTAGMMLEETHVRDVGESLGCDVVNLSRGEMVQVEVPKGYEMKAFMVHPRVAEADRIISIPVMKTHSSTAVTLSMKNMLGVLPERKKARYHPNLDHIISDVVAALPPDLCIIDATVGLEGEGPFKGKPVKLDMIMAGDNAVSVDSCAVWIMGFEPRSVDHIRLAGDMGLGVIDLDGIDVKGLRLEEARRAFERAPVVKADRMVSRVSTHLGYWAIHRHYEQAVKSWRERRA
ncbi:MAG: DUF362 domain-containing protein [Candidatus Bathyarchaeia archaeon]